VQQALAARRKSVPEGQWITSMGGWHPNQWAEHRHPTLKELDDAVPDRPVFLYERFTGPAVTNSMGKKLFDAIDAAAPVHPDVKKVAVSTPAPLPRRALPAAAPPRARSSTCAACRRTPTSVAARSTR
jgi:predicted amidohydrolase YtcJ